MSQAPDSLDENWPSPGGRGPTSPMTEPQPQQASPEGGEVVPPQFDRVAEVLGPLEQVVLAADQRLGAIQQQVSVQAGEESAHIERRVREAAAAQRQRIANLRQELTSRRSEVSSRFDTILQLLDEVDRDLALRAGAEVQVALTERQTVEIAHEVPPATGLTPAAAVAPPPAPPAAAPAAATAPAPPKEGRLARWFRRSKNGSSN